MTAGGRRGKRAKPIVHSRDHEHGGVDPVRIHFEDVGTSGGGTDGLAVKYYTYPQSGGYIAADTNGGGIAFMNLDTGDSSPVSLTQRDDGGLQLQNEGDGDLNIQSSGSGNLVLQVATGLLVIYGLPTSAPLEPNTVWNDGGTLKIT